LIAVSAEQGSSNARIIETPSSSITIVKEGQVKM
jgi:hypothetical protein